MTSIAIHSCDIFGMTKAQQVSVHTRKQELLVLLLTTCMPFRAVWKAILSVCTNHKCQWRVSEITKETRSHYSTFNSFCFTDCITVLFPIEKKNHIDFKRELKGLKKPKNNHSTVWDFVYVLSRVQNSKEWSPGAFEWSVLPGERAKSVSSTIAI